MNATMMRELMPRSEEAERAVLGAVLLDPRLLGEVRSRLHHADFWLPKHAWIYEGMLALAEGLDVQTLMAWLEDRGLTSGPEAVTVADLSGLDRELPDPSRIGLYVEIVYERALRRRTIEVAMDVEREAMSGQSATEILTRALGRLTALSSSSTPGVGFRAAGEIIEEWLTDVSEQDGEREPGMMTGIPGVDRLIGGMERRHMWLIGARPGVGKTSLMLQAVAQEALGAHPRHCAVFSLEMDERELLLRLMSQESGIRSSLLRRGRMGKEDWAIVHALRRHIRETGTIHVDQQASINVGAIAARLRQLQQRVPVAAVFVDYLTLVASESVKDKSYERTQANARALAALAKEANVKMIVAAQLSRDNQKGNRKPRLADLREAGEEPAWGVMLLHRPETGDGDTLSTSGEVIVAKNRTGATGSVDVAFEGVTQRFREI